MLIAIFKYAKRFLFKEGGVKFFIYGAILLKFET